MESSQIVERWSGKKQAEVAAFQSRLNALGAEGWEMVSFDTVPLTGRFSENIKGYVYWTFFKRPVGGNLGSQARPWGGSGANRSRTSAVRALTAGRNRRSRYVTG